jgi:uncharacterized membrane protein YkoI
MFNIRSKLVTAAAMVAAIGTSAGIAAAATGNNSSGSASSGTQTTHTVNGRSEQALTGSTLDKVRAAALAKVPGTVDRVETNVDGSAPYEAHIVRKSDGTEVEVQVSKDFAVVAVNQMGGDHDGDGPGHP